MAKIMWQKKAQSTAEYAILLALIIGAAMAMQVYVKRGLQGRVYDASNKFYTDVTKTDGDESWQGINDDVIPDSTKQLFEPTGLTRVSTDITTTDKETTKMGEGGTTTRDITQESTRGRAGDYQKYDSPN